MSETQYIVLLGSETLPNNWKVIGSAMASGANTAKRKVISELLAEDPGYELPIEAKAIAVPASSWNPQPVKLDVQTRLKIG